MSTGYTGTCGDKQNWSGSMRNWGRLSFIRHAELSFPIPDKQGRGTVQTALTTGNSSLLQPLALPVLYTPSLGTGDRFSEYSIQ